MKLESAKALLRNNAKVENMYKDHFCYKLFFTNDRFYTGEVLDFDSWMTCLGYIGDLISFANTNEAATGIMSRIHSGRSIDELKELNNIGVIMPHSKNIIKNLKQIRENWNMDFTIFNCEELVVIVGDLKKMFKTKWKLQGLMQYARATYKHDECVRLGRHNESSFDAFLNINLGQSLTKLINTSHDFEDDCFDFTQPESTPGYSPKYHSHERGILYLAEHILNIINNGIPKN